jgi:type I restriction enzyme R subunit
MQSAHENKTKKSPNFSFLSEHSTLLAQCVVQAERYVFDDPNTALIKLRQFGELLAQEVAARTGVEVFPVDNAITVLRKLEDNSILTPKATQLFHNLRKTGNKAVHQIIGDQGEALYHLRMARQLAVWFHKSFGTNPELAKGPFIPPPDPTQADTDLKAELQQLRRQLAQVQKASLQKATKVEHQEIEIQKMYEDLNAAISLAQESEEQFLAEKQKHQEYIVALQAKAKAEPATIKIALVKAATADQEIDLNEADTRKIIDAQLREAGWETDTKKLTYKKGVRPQKGKNTAISEWPTKKGPADYVLFVGLTAIGIVEAKRKNKDVSGSIEQSKRYSKGFKAKEGWEQAGGPWGKYNVPFLFATNGKPFLRQLKTKSGIWFLDGRLPTNHPRPLDSWYTPEGLKGLLKIDVKEAEEKLSKEPTDYLGLREYQLEAIMEAEKAIANKQQQILLAMATGTGKTRTCIGLSYRLLKAKRFRRILFLIDRTSLGEQAAGAFKDVKLENLQSFSDIYDVKELGDVVPETDTRLHIATIQGMIRRLLYPGENTLPLAVDQYDCIVVDECHRGYALDREMTEGELSFRSEKDYISKYTRVLDHFDAVKIGLTATPALHTTEIFGEPVYTYSYRKAVIEGYLRDHEPPIRILTKLVDKGMTWKVNEDMAVYHVNSGMLTSHKTPDEVTIEVEKFNTFVITEKFNKTICAELAKHIDPDLPGKTLVFCATDSHADMVVTMLKEAFVDQYGEVDDDAVQKITAAADKPLEKIRRYKLEKYPSVAVTVDLLTTGIDVPEIVNLVFIRRVKSRILYEQMIGRATRLCDEIGKDLFRIFDTVDLYAALEPYSTMKPVVVNPKITFAQLVEELVKVEDEDHRKEIRDQIAAKMQYKKRLLKDKTLDQFKMLAGGPPKKVIGKLIKMSGDEVKDFFVARPGLPKFLDTLKAKKERVLIISGHDDEIIEVAHGYGKYKKPQDYLESFGKYIKDNMNKIPALVVVTTKPRDLTRKQLKELKLLLDQEGYNETILRTAWKETNNVEIAASIIGFIRQSVLDSPFKPYKERVKNSMNKILTSQQWTVPQKKWLERIGKQLEKETIVDRTALDSGRFKEVGGFNRLNKVFDGKMNEILGEISDELWKDTATG